MATGGTAVREGFFLRNSHRHRSATSLWGRFYGHRRNCGPRRFFRRSRGVKVAVPKLFIIPKKLPSAPKPYQPLGAFLWPQAELRSAKVFPKKLPSAPKRYQPLGAFLWPQAELRSAKVFPKKLPSAPKRYQP